VPAGAAQDRHRKSRSAGAAWRRNQRKTLRLRCRPAISASESGSTTDGATARRRGMKPLRGKNLQLAGIELVLPTVWCIEGRQFKRARVTLTVGYATGYVDTIVAPLVAEWLSRHFHRRFAEHGRGAEGDLAVEAFYDKLASHFRRETPFL